MGCGDACPIFPGKRYESWDESTRQLEMGATPSSRGSQN
jgi:hypothetical protein